MRLIEYFELKVAGDINISKTFEKITDRKLINIFLKPESKMTEAQKESFEKIKSGNAYIFDPSFDSYYFYVKGENKNHPYVLNLKKIRGKKVYYLVDFKELSGDMKFTERVAGVNTNDLFYKIFKILKESKLKNFAFEGAKEEGDDKEGLSSRDKLYIRILVGNKLVPSKDSITKQKLDGKHYLTFSLL